MYIWARRAGGKTSSLYLFIQLNCFRNSEVEVGHLKQKRNPASLIYLVDNYLSWLTPPSYNVILPISSSPVMLLMQLGRRPVDSLIGEVTIRKWDNYENPCIRASWEWRLPEVVVFRFSKIVIRKWALAPLVTAGAASNRLNFSTWVWHLTVIF